MRCSVLLLLLLLGTGCATIFNGTTDVVLFQVTPPDATITVNGQKYTPGQHIAVSRGQDIVIASPDGDVVIPPGGYARRNLNIITIVNVLFWPGFIVDLLTNAFWDFPPIIYVTIQKKGRPVRPEGELP